MLDTNQEVLDHVVLGEKVLQFDRKPTESDLVSALESFANERLWAIDIDPGEFHWPTREIDGVPDGIRQIIGGVLFTVEIVQSFEPMESEAVAYYIELRRYHDYP